MYSPTNGPWVEADRVRLIRLWSIVPSIALIAIQMNRSIASVQSQASRLGLPRRNNKIGKSYNRWTESEYDKLLKCLVKHTDSHNKVHIVPLADELNRSIDTIISKLIEEFDSEEEVLRACHVSINENQSPEHKSKFFDDRKLAKPRKCMTCQLQFWSEGAHNRICARCKEKYSDIDPVDHSVSI